MKVNNLMVSAFSSFSCTQDMPLHIGCAIASEPNLYRNCYLFIIGHKHPTLLHSLSSAENVWNLVRALCNRTGKERRVYLRITR